MSFVNIFEKIDSVIMAPRCIWWEASVVWLGQEITGCPVGVHRECGKNDFITIFICLLLISDQILVYYVMSCYRC